MSKRNRSNESGSILVMAVILSFAAILMGVVFLRSALTFREDVSFQVKYKQAYYSAIGGMNLGFADHIAGRVRSPGWKRFYEYDHYLQDFDYVRKNASRGHTGYGYTSSIVIEGKGQSTLETDGTIVDLNINGEYQYETYADYLYISNKERDARRNVIIRFWTPDTLDGKVHSNDTIHIVASQDRPRFMRHVTTTMGYIDPPQNHARFDEGWDYGAPIIFPDQATEIRFNAGYKWHTSGDTLWELTLDMDQIRYRKCWPDPDRADSIKCDYTSIAAAPYILIPTSGVVFVYGKCWVKASRNLVDRMDGEYPERSWTDGGFISDGFHGQLTIGSSDTMIIPDNLIFYQARSNNSIPTTMDSCSDILGLVSENYIMIGEKVRNTVYINAALAAIKGSISVQDIYENYPPGWDNEKQSLFIWGSLAQRNRGIVRTTDYPPGHVRGFPEKDYHYDVRLQDNPPPHFLPALKSEMRVVGDLYSGSGDQGGG